MRRILLAATVVAGLSGLTSIAAAQEPVRTAYEPYPHFGLQLSYGDAADLGIGLRYENRMTALFPYSPNLRFQAAFDYFFPDNDRKYWELNANVLQLIRVQNARVLPYVGGGLNLAHVPGNSEVGLNLIGGLRLPGQSRPFLEARIELGGGEQFVITGGWLFW